MVDMSVTNKITRVEDRVYYQAVKLTFKDLNKYRIQGGNGNE